jgi:hypothetical protein
MIQMKKAFILFLNLALIFSLRAQVSLNNKSFFSTELSYFNLNLNNCGGFALNNNFRQFKLSIGAQIYAYKNEFRYSQTDPIRLKKVNSYTYLNIPVLVKLKLNKLENPNSLLLLIGITGTKNLSYKSIIYFNNANKPLNKIDVLSSKNGGLSITSGIEYNKAFKHFNLFANSIFNAKIVKDVLNLNNNIPGSLGDTYEGERFQLGFSIGIEIPFKKLTIKWKSQNK